MPLNHIDLKVLGISTPINTDGPKPVDIKLTSKLTDFMRPYGVFESDEELAHRYIVILLNACIHYFIFSAIKKCLCA